MCCDELWCLLVCQVLNEGTTIFSISVPSLLVRCLCFAMDHNLKNSHINYQVKLLLHVFFFEANYGGWGRGSPPGNYITKVQTFVTETVVTGGRTGTWGECLHSFRYKSQAWMLSAVPAFLRTKRFFHTARSSVTRVIIFVMDVWSPWNTSPFRASQRRHSSVSNIDGHSLTSRLLHVCSYK